MKNFSNVFYFLSYFLEVCDVYLEEKEKGLDQSGWNPRGFILRDLEMVI